jgi:hypothetical protein
VLATLRVPLHPSFELDNENDDDDTDDDTEDSEVSEHEHTPDVDRNTDIELLDHNGEQQSDAERAVDHGAERGLGEACASSPRRHSSDADSDY